MTTAVSMSASVRATVSGVLHNLSIPGCTPDATCVTNACDPNVASDLKELAVTVVHPCITVTKNCSPTSCDPLKMNFSGIVSNCGDTVLTNIVVTDFVAGQGNVTITNVASLTAGGKFTYGGSYTPTTQTSSDTITAQAQEYFTFGQVSGTASSTCTVTCTPAIDVNATCTNAVALGQPIYFSGIVSNPGCVALTSVQVWSDQAGLVLAIGSLAPGATTPFNGSYIPIDCTDTTNAIMAVGSAPALCGGASVTDTVQRACTVGLGPAISVNKVVDCPTDVSDLTIYVSATVSNIGNTALSGISVTDYAPPVTNALARMSGPVNLLPGQSAVYTGSYIAVSLPSSDTVVATGQGLAFCPNGTNLSVTASDSEVCNLTCNPSIDVTKVNICPTREGDSITFTGLVSNTGNTPLENVTVVDDKAGAITNVSLLGIGASFGYSGSYLPGGLPSTNTVTATGTVPAICPNIGGSNVSDSASAVCEPPGGKCVTRTPGYWFNHLTSSDPNCATLKKAIQANGGRLNLGFICLPTNGTANATQAMKEALSFFPPSSTGWGDLCDARKHLAFHLIAAIANSALFGTNPGDCRNPSCARLPSDLIETAQRIAACDDAHAIRGITEMLDQFNNSGDNQPMPLPYRACGLGGATARNSLRVNIYSSSNCGNTNNCASGGHACP